MTEKTGGKRKLSPKLYVQVEESLNLRSPKIKDGLRYLSGNEKKESDPRQIGLFCEKETALLRSMSVS